MPGVYVKVDGSWIKVASHDTDKFGVAFDSSKFSSGNCFTYTYDLSGSTPLNNSATTGTVNSSMSWGSWQTLEDNPYLKDCYYSLTYGDGTEVKLNPYDLTKALDGTDMSAEITAENVMFNIPTRYILRNANGITHSRNPASGMPYAHTIDGDVYKWCAIGVYPSVNVSNTAKSVSGVAPSGLITRPDFRTYSRANGSPSNGIWLQWNFHHYLLLRDIILMSILHWDSQTRIGKGNISGSSAVNWVVNGIYNTQGLFAGSQSSGAGYGVKALVENMWGEAWQWTDDVVTGDVYDEGGYYWKDVWAGQNSVPQCTENETTSDTGAIITSDKINVGRFCLGSSASAVSAGWKYPTAIGYSSMGWGLPVMTGGSSSTYTFDGYYTGASTDATARNMAVGGYSNMTPRAGVSVLTVNGAVRGSALSFGSRLAFVHD